MNKFIELYTVHFVSTNGIVLTLDNPRIEATKENLEKLNDCIEAGYLHIVEVESENELKDMSPATEEGLPIMSDELLNVEVPNVKRLPEFTDEELKKMNKKELMELAKELELDVKQSMKVKELEEVIKEALK